MRDKKISNQFYAFSNKISLSAEAKQFLEKERHNLLWILSKIHEIPTYNTSPRYESLFEKTCNFLTYALLNSKFNEILQFISLAKITIDPLNKSKRNLFHESRVELLWGINNLKHKEQEAKENKRITKIKNNIRVLSLFATSAAAAAYIYNEFNVFSDLLSDLGFKTAKEKSDVKRTMEAYGCNVNTFIIKHCHDPQTALHALAKEQKQWIFIKKHKQLNYSEYTELRQLRYKIAAACDKKLSFLHQHHQITAL
jgi:hypothetical protein